MSTGEFNHQSLNVRLAAHPRVVATDYTNDHVWELAWGRTRDEPVLSAQTRYNGRAGLVRLVPVLRINDQSYYTPDDLETQPQLTLLTPDALILMVENWAKGVKVRMVWWVIDSQTLIGRFHFINTNSTPCKIDVQLFLQGMSNKQPLPVHQLEVEAGTSTLPALTVKNIAQVFPILLLEQSAATDTAALMSSIQLGGKSESTLKWVLVSQNNFDHSLAHAYETLSRSWTQDLQALPERAKSFPQITIGNNNDTLDAAIALSVNAIAQHILSPYGKLPYPFPIMSRTPSSTHKGLRPVPPLDMFHYTASLAVLDPALAQGIVRNYGRLQHSDGWIDAQLNPEGEGAGYLLLPMLIHLTQIVDFYGEDRPFLMELFIKVMSFYPNWFKLDADGDGFPEWQSLHQANYEYHPLASLSLTEAPPIDIRTLESPDLAAYLLREGVALATLAKKISKKTFNLWQKQESLYQKLADSLQQSWQGEGFTYRDRDTNTLLKGQKWVTLKGDETLSETITLPTPNRMVVLVEGSQSAPPVNLAITLEGLNAKGETTQETLVRDSFAWHRSHYAATTQTLWREIHRTKISGLSRVYKYTLESVDMDRRDLSLLLPYLWKDLPEAQVSAIFKDLQENYWHPFGLSTLSKNDPYYSRTDNNARHMVMPWVTLLGLAMLEHKEDQASVDLFKAVAQAVAKSLVEQGAFFQWYDAENGTGLGQMNHVTGTISLHWLMQLLGFYIRHGGEVMIWRSLAFNEEVRVKWHGVTVTRTPQTMKIEFPSGHVVDFEGKIRVQTVTDPAYKPPAPAPMPTPQIPKPQKINIQLERQLPDEGLWGEAG